MPASPSGRQPRHQPLVGTRIRRRRHDPRLALEQVSEQTGLNIGPGDHVLLAGTLSQDAEILGERAARLIVVYPRGARSELTQAEDGP